MNKELMRRGDLLGQRGELEQFQKQALEGLASKIMVYRKQYHDMQKEKDTLYEDYADGQMNAHGYRSRADKLAGKMENWRVR